MLFILVLGFAFVGPMIHDQDPTQAVGGLYNAPSVKAPLGTDNLGHDVLSQLMHGTKTSLLVGLIAGIVAIVIGVAVGSLAGYLGGIADEILMGLTNVFITIPQSIFDSVVGLGDQPFGHWNGSNHRDDRLAVGSTGCRRKHQSANQRHVDWLESPALARWRWSSRKFSLYVLFIFMAFIRSRRNCNEATLSMLGLGPSNVVP